MIGKNDKKKNGVSKLDSMPISTVIGADIVFSGDIKGESIIRIDGKVEGNILMKQGIVLGEKAHVTGNIESEHVIVYGNITGNIKSKELVVKATGRVNGDIFTDAVEIEMGGKYNGKLSMHNSQQACTSSKEKP